jgi:hypothetical protein
MSSLRADASEGCEPATNVSKNEEYQRVGECVKRCLEVISRVSEGARQAVS